MRRYTTKGELEEYLEELKEKLNGKLVKYRVSNRAWDLRIELWLDSARVAVPKMFEKQVEDQIRMVGPVTLGLQFKFEWVVG
ncbi:MAG TPA: hypothetical protein VFT74_05450 [Isosphaeraceae bacterium]|nr:hypothetical protein [Isosphaeraceae bacterium]